MDKISDELFEEIEDLSLELSETKEEILNMKEQLTELQKICNYYESKWFDILNTLKFISMFIGILILGLLIKNFNSIWSVIIIALLWFFVSTLSIWLIIKSIKLLIKLFKKIF